MSKMLKFSDSFVLSNICRDKQTAVKVYALLGNPFNYEKLVALFDLLLSTDHYHISSVELFSDIDFRSIATMDTFNSLRLGLMSDPSLIVSILQEQKDENFLVVFWTLWTLMFHAFPFSNSDTKYKVIPYSINMKCSWVPVLEPNGCKYWSPVCGFEPPASTTSFTNAQLQRIAMGIPLMDKLNSFSKTDVLLDAHTLQDWCSNQGFGPSRIPPRLEDKAREEIFALLYNRNICSEFPNDPLQEFKVPFNAVNTSQTVRSKNGWMFMPRGLITVSMIFALLFSITSASCVSFNGTVICNLSDYLNHFPLEHSVEGIYRVCFDDHCILRYRKGNNKKYDPVDSNRIYPYRCPSPDWEPVIKNSTYEPGCYQCKGKVLHGFCSYGQTLRDYVIKVVQPNSDYNLSIGSDAIYYGNLKPHQINIYYTHYDPRPNHYQHQIGTDQLSVSLLIIGTLFIISIIVAIIDLIGFRGKVDYNKVDEVELTEAESGMVLNLVQPRRHFPDWVKGALITFWLMCLFTCVSADFNLASMQDIDYYVENYSLPSVCSCSNIGEPVSQLSCSTSCISDVKLADTILHFDFALMKSCVPKYLVVLEWYEEEVYRGCSTGSAHDYVNKWCGRAMACQTLAKDGIGYGCCGSCKFYCAWSSETKRWANWGFRVFPSELCTYNERVNPKIYGMDNLVFTYSIHSTLLSQNTVLNVDQSAYGGPKSILYKVVNGAVASDRAWIVDPSCIESGKVKESCYVNQLMPALMVGTSKDCGSCWNHSLPAFTPSTISDACSVTVHFENLPCYSVPIIHNATYVIIGNSTMVRVSSEGMIEGKYVGKDEEVLMPDNWYKCGNCTAVDDIHDCLSPYINDSGCTAIWYEEEMHNKSSNSNHNWYSDLNSSIKWGVSAGALILIVIIIIVILTSCCCCKRS